MKNKERYLNYILTVILAILLVYVIIAKSSQVKYKKMHEKQLNALKVEKNNQIQISEKKIKALKEDNRLKDEKIRMANYRIDSLEKEKQKVRIEYIIKYKKIEKYNAEQVLNYWENEFKK